MHTKWRKGHQWISRTDMYLVRHVSKLPGGKHDVFFRRLSASANHGKLWIGVAAILATIPGRPRRAALHGLLAQAVASAVTNGIFKTLLPRARPLPEHLPVFRCIRSRAVRPCPRATPLLQWRSPWAPDWSSPPWGLRWPRRPWEWRTRGFIPGRTGPQMCSSVRRWVPALPWQPGGGGPPPPPPLTDFPIEGSLTGIMRGTTPVHP